MRRLFFRFHCHRSSQKLRWRYIPISLTEHASMLETIKILSLRSFNFTGWEKQASQLHEVTVKCKTNKDFHRFDEQSSQGYSRPFVTATKTDICDNFFSILISFWKIKWPACSTVGITSSAKDAGCPKLEFLLYKYSFGNLKINAYKHSVSTIQ